MSNQGARNLIARAVDLGWLTEVGPLGHGVESKADLIANVRRQLEGLNGITLSDGE